MDYYRLVLNETEQIAIDILISELFFPWIYIYNVSNSNSTAINNQTLIKHSNGTDTMYVELDAGEYVIGIGDGPLFADEYGTYQWSVKCASQCLFFCLSVCICV
jgi:hypothetical protein